MNRTEYLSAINEFFYQGEVLGEAFFGRCLELETDPARRYTWATLQQLETEAKAKLRPFLMGLGLSIVQNDVSGQVAEFTTGFSAKPWPELMKMIAEVTDFYLEKFREIEADAPDDEREMARAMVAHEAALNKFARLELAGDVRNSLADVISQLQWPMTPPTA